MTRFPWIRAAKLAASVEGTLAVSAPARSMTPAPIAGFGFCTKGSAVDINSALTWSGVRFGRAWSSSATSPEVTAVACEVPEPRKNRLDVSPATRPSGC